MSQDFLWGCHLRLSHQKARIPSVCCQLSVLINQWKIGRTKWTMDWKNHAKTPSLVWWTVGGMDVFNDTEILLIVDNKVTWLILPVVICLSQRLSHACLSINNFILWNCERLITSAIIYLMVPYYMDNCSNSRANTCAKSRPSRGGMYLLDKKPMRLRSDLCWIIVTSRMAWLYVGHRSFKFLPYQLSTVV